MSLSSDTKPQYRFTSLSSNGSNLFGKNQKKFRARPASSKPSGLNPQTTEMYTNLRPAPVVAASAPNEENEFRKKRLKPKRPQSSKINSKNYDMKTEGLSKNASKKGIEDGLA